MYTECSFVLLDLNGLKYYNKSIFLNCLVKLYFFGYKNIFFLKYKISYDLNYIPSSFQV